jgi:hypothetical protein
MQIAKTILRRAAHAMRRILGIHALHDRLDRMSRQLDQLSAINQTSQMQLMMRYREMRAGDSQKPQFLSDVGFRSQSQDSIDGLLLYVFSLIGTTNRHSVEMCAGDGLECNTANLIIHHGWSGLLFDGNEALLQRGRKFYAQSPDTLLAQPTLVSAWITAENVNDLIQQNGFEGEVDLFSLDMDGMDWWVWKALTVIQPRVVVVEYQDCWGPDAAVTVPYKSDFVAKFDEYGIPAFSGASLNAFVKLAKQKGYRLVGCERLGYNAVFVRNDITEPLLPEVSPATCFNHPKNKWAMQTRLPQLKNLGWEEV